MDDSSERLCVLSYNMAEKVWKNSSSASRSHMTEVLWGAQSRPFPLSVGGRDEGMQKSKTFRDFSKGSQWFLYTLWGPWTGRMVRKVGTGGEWVPRHSQWRSLLEHYSNLPNNCVHTCVHVNVYKYIHWVTDPQILWVDGKPSGKRRKNE